MSATDDDETSFSEEGELVTHGSGVPSDEELEELNASALASHRRNPKAEAQEGLAEEGAGEPDPGKLLEAAREAAQARRRRALK